MLVILEFYLFPPVRFRSFLLCMWWYMCGVWLLLGCVGLQGFSVRTNTYLYRELLYARSFDFLASPGVGENQKCEKHQCLGIGALNPFLYLLASFIGRRMYKGYEELKVCTFFADVQMES